MVAILAPLHQWRGGIDRIGELQGEVSCSSEVGREFLASCCWPQVEGALEEVPLHLNLGGGPVHMGEGCTFPWEMAPVLQNPSVPGLAFPTPYARKHKELPTIIETCMDIVHWFNHPCLG